MKSKYLEDRTHLERLPEGEFIDIRKVEGYGCGDERVMGLIENADGNKRTLLVKDIGGQYSRIKIDDIRKARIADGLYCISVDETFGTINEKGVSEERVEKNDRGISKFEELLKK